MGAAGISFGGGEPRSPVLLKAVAPTAPLIAAPARALADASVPLLVDGGVIDIVGVPGADAFLSLKGLTGSLNGFGSSPELDTGTARRSQALPPGFGRVKLRGLPAVPIPFGLAGPKFPLLSRFLAAPRSGRNCVTGRRLNLGAFAGDFSPSLNAMSRGLAAVALNFSFSALS